MEYLKILEAQKEFYKLGYTKTVVYREMMLRELEKSLKMYRDDLFEALEKDLNKHYFESFVSEYFMLQKSLAFTIKNLNKSLKDKRVRTPFYLPFMKSYIRKVPYGNALILNAYNYPLLLAIDPLIGAIAGGNTVMLGLSKKSRHTNKVLIEMINTTFDNNYIFAFETDRNINNKLLTYKFDKIFFTGSEKVGKIILEAASKNLISTTLELGGKSPALVSDRADIARSAESILYSKVLNGGQTCIAVDYVLVDYQVVDDLIDKLKYNLEKFYPDFKLFPKMIDKASFERIISIYNSDKDYLINDVIIDYENNIISPIFLKVDIEDSRKLASMTDEIFGPILPIIVYKDIDDAIDLISEYKVPLAFYPFTKHPGELDYLFEHIEFGGSTVNDTLFHFVNHYLPFSGFKDSGSLSYHGKYSIDTFTYTQPITKRSKFFSYKMLYPPYKNIFKKK